MQLIKSIQSGLQRLLGVQNIVTPGVKYSTQLYNRIYPLWSSYKDIAAFKLLDDIYSVVTRLAKNSAAIPLYGYNDSMEDLPGNDKLAVFLRSLTYVQKLELYTWLYLKGECFIYKERTLGVNGTVTKIHFINPAYITLVLTDEWPEQIAYFLYRDPQRGFEFPIVKEDMIFIKNFNPSDYYVESWRGLSAVQVLCQRLNRMEANMRNSVAQMQNGGVPGVMYAKDVPNTAAGKVVIDGAKDNFGRFVKNPDNKGAPFMQGGEWGYFSIGSDLVDLRSIELEEVDFKKVCNAWGLSARLFNFDGTGSEISDDNAQLGMYTNAIIPAVTMVEDAFNTELAGNFGVGIRIVRHDLDSVYILTEIKHKRALIWRDLPMYIPNRLLEDMGEATIDDPMMDQPLFKSGYMPKDQLEPLPPIE